MVGIPAIHPVHAELSFSLSSSPRIAAVIVAAGKGERASTAAASVPKQYRDVAGRAVLARTIEAMLSSSTINLVLPVIHRDHLPLYLRLGLSDPRLLPSVFGEDTRQDSVLSGLEALVPYRPDLVLVQDAARPFVSGEIIEAVVDRLANFDGVVPVIPVTDTIKRVSDGQSIEATEDRAKLYAAQTPQGFRFPAILEAHRRAGAITQTFTDDSAIAEWAGLRVAIAPGSPGNIKITHPEDFARAERLAGREQLMETRIGTGFDVHPFEPGDAVWLGGVRIAHTHRLKGHSDADVALHALADAIYGALGEGDIGTHFPPSDPQWRGAASRLFLDHAAGLVRERGGRIVNLDLTLVCEAPRISPHVPAMREAIGEACAISSKRVAIKATTSERLGFTGREEGIVAMASASIEVPREEME